MFDRRQWQKFDLEHLRLDEDVWNEMDSSNNGTLSRAEFLQFALLRQGIVSREVIKYVNEIFDVMDPGKTNSLSFEHVRGLQRQRRKDLLREQKNLSPR